MGIKDMTKEEVLESLRESIVEFSPLESDFTIKDIERYYGLGRNSARSKKDKLIAEGRIVEVGTLRFVKYYRLVK